MARRSTLGVCSSLLAAWIIGCSSFGSNTPTDRPSDDAGTADSNTSIPDAASEGAIDPCPGNLLPNGDFEKSTDGWDVIYGTSIDLTHVDGRTGKAGRACFKVGPYLSVTDEPTTVKGAAVGARYRFSGWLRTEGAPGGVVGTYLRERDPTSGQYIGRSSEKTDAVPTWTRVVVEHTMTGASLDLEVYFAIDPAPASTCLELDDLCFQKLP